MAANAATPTTPTASKSNGIRRYYCDDIRYDVKCFSYITLLWIRLTLGVLPQSAQRTRRREEMNAVLTLRGGYGVGAGGASHALGGQVRKRRKRILTSQCLYFCTIKASTFAPVKQVLL